MQTINPPLRLLASFTDAYGTTPTQILQVPGRDMWMAATVVETGKICIVAPDLEARTTFDRRSARTQRSTTNRPLPRWATYCAGALLKLAYEQMELPGANIAIVGAEPSGPRYVYTLGMAFVAIVLNHFQQEYDSDRLIDVIEAVRRDYIS
ncbi:hypothetical protein G4Y79_22210 [Phototrophicus methaneseepsis]|uniref:Uncharacterized protein n=1 Tax=Phototrophicus methaneseepsis TaxID=2710758 RepID=A0A7S8IDA1_9CHLR|nr:hypothetical protein [Phototrophicus methaneseepsis]QPC82365.1 hypothetical protein G4Y79_22210 [Phototrophicus methaneseepsis]